MKKLTLFVAAILFSTMAFSQERLTGPKFKNAAPGTVHGPKTTLVHDASPVTLQGPVSKNTPVWMSKPSSKSKVVFRDAVDNPKGPAAKNRNPWDK